MGVIMQVLKGLGKFFILVSYLIFSVSSILFFFDYAVRVPSQSLIWNGLALVAIICYLAAAAPLTFFVVTCGATGSATKPKQQAQEQTTLMSYVSDIHTTVHKNNEAIMWIARKIQEDEEKQEDITDQ